MRVIQQYTYLIEDDAGHEIHHTDSRSVANMIKAAYERGVINQHNVFKAIAYIEVIARKKATKPSFETILKHIRML
jgi:hypothetical protein